MEHRLKDLHLSVKKALNLIYKNEPVSIKVSLGMAMFPANGELPDEAHSGGSASGAAGRTYWRESSDIRAFFP